ncbi:pilus assembly PilX N-terminal domain-containing protein [Desulfurobacterium sp.]
MEKRKGVILITVLGVITVLSIAGAIATYVISGETKSTGSTKQSVAALKLAESGIEVGLTNIKNNYLTTYTSLSNVDELPARIRNTGVFNRIKTKAQNGEISQIYISPVTTLNGGDYQVAIFKGTDGTYTLISVGEKNNSSRVVEVVTESSGTFYPFSINGKFDIGSLTSPDWTDAEMGVYQIDSGLKTELESVGFNVHGLSNPNLPKAAKINATALYPDESACDYGSYSSDITISSSVSDRNGDGKVTICGKNITVNTEINQDKLTLAAENNIYVNDEITDKGRKTEWELEIIAGNDLIFGTSSHSKIKYTGKTDNGYNALIYAGNSIKKPGGSGGMLEVKGRQDTSSISNVFIITPGTIDIDAKLVHQTGKTDLLTNYVIWADRGISAENIHITGKGTQGRNWAMIVADGDATFDKWQFMKNTHPSGLTYQEIKNFCENGASYGIPVFYSDIYCELKNQIDSSGGIGKIKEWKVY